MAYNGTKLGQDSRFKDPDKELLSSMKTPKIYKTTVSKQNLIILPIIKLWLNQKIKDVLEFEDETLANLIINLIKSSNDKIDPKNIQYQISGFLGDKTYSFMKNFWKLLINIQTLFLKDKSIPEELIPYQEEYEKRKQFYQSNKRKINDFDDLLSNNNMNNIQDDNIDIDNKNNNKSKKIYNKRNDDDYDEYKKYRLKDKEEYKKNERN